MIKQREPDPEEADEPEDFLPTIPPMTPDVIRDFEESPLPAVVRAGFTDERMKELVDLVEEAHSSRTSRYIRPMRVHDLRVTWRYLERGKVAHALKTTELSGGAGHAQQAQCGLDPGDTLAWMGTGSQDEYEKAESLRKCKNCWQNISTS